MYQWIHLVLADQLAYNGRRLILVSRKIRTQPLKGKCQMAKPDVSKIFGKIQYVEHFPDYKVQVVEHFADLHVEIVSHFPNQPGKWEIVEHFPNFKIQLVEHFPDFTVKFVKHFPGPQKK